MSTILDSFLMVLGSAVMLAAPAYLVLQLWATVHLKAGWRIAALAPVVIAAPLVLWCAYAFVQYSNLWPLPFLLFAPFGTAYLGLVVLLHRWSGARAA